MCDWIFKQISKLFSKNEHSSSSDTTSEDEAVNILDYLSPELLELIFIHLDVNSLKSCLEVSKTFKDTIIHSAVIMKRIPMTINDENWKSNLQFIQIYGKYVRNVKVECGKDYLIIYRLLDLMPNILKLRVKVENYFPESEVSTLNDIDPNLMELPKQSFNELKLEILELPSTSYSYVKFIQKFLGIKTLKKFCLFISDDKSDSDILVPFICQQNNLQHLELNLKQIDKVFTSDAIYKMKFNLKILKIEQFNSIPSDYTCFNKFLLNQSESLEELEIFTHDCVNGIINEQVMKLQKLEKLTTYGLLSCFKSDCQIDDKTLMPNLKYLKFYKGYGFDDFEQIDTSFMPNLECLRVHFGFHELFSEHFPKLDLNLNPLKKLMNLKEFHVENQKQNFFLNLILSPNLESLIMEFDELFFKTETWTKLASNLPNLQRLVLIKIENEDFLNFIIEHVEDLLDLTGNDKLKILNLHSKQDNFEIVFENRKVVKCFGYSCEKFSPLYSNQSLIRKKYKNFNFTLLTKFEFDEKFNNLEVYFVFIRLLRILVDIYPLQ